MITTTETLLEKLAAGNEARWCELVPTNGAHAITGKRFP